MCADEPTRRHFDEQARAYYQANYEAPRNRHAYNLALRREACLRLLPTTKGPTLDLGCGPGAMTIPLLERGHSVTWTDISKEMVAETSRRAAQLGVTSRGAIANATALPFADRAFDLVVTTGVLEYVSEIREALAEIARVLTPKGTLIATMSLPRRLERMTTRAVATLRGSPTIKQYIYARAPFDEMIESAGLLIEARRCCVFAPFPLDAVWPGSVLWIDKLLADSLNRSEIACELAKTYIVRARVA